MSSEDTRSARADHEDRKGDERAVVGGTNVVLFDFRALATFDNHRPRVVTLSDTGSLRVSLIMLRAGQSLAPQPMASEASVQALRGRLRLSAGPAHAEASAGASGELSGEASTELRAGRLAQVEAGTPFRLRALGEAVVLLSLAPSPGEAALDEALRSDVGPLVTRA